MWPRRTGLLGPRTAAMLKAEPGAAHQSGSALPSFSSLWTINAPLHTHTHRRRAGSVCARSPLERYLPADWVEQSDLLLLIYGPN